ncbi:hypothetical protein TMatcc_008194 [Talaromyces marneffei ATCC 18224]|uniref:Prolyl 4-hydroxylase alpha subunit domain-containing protein n=2 Tax=Talaromyces marneffei TaxID=37727 RepID=B6QN59_TALMQ|nr:uncharacterized protein EYB26_007558 [Talaromyces marneffei]EEA22364.1 conserved hypothetical protein [Talaromyces marneffei ATCC 18224]KAE8550194.1 hypothetical protein EYB25_006415 [Talaromyces marneffei]QGA19863.1 hypothetical protein EYB26_007558 [Talaromyces marneffei]
MPADVRPEFLPPQAPHNVTSTIIDFTATTPAIPEYKSCFAAVIDNFMTAAECKELIALAEQSTPDGKWERAMINVGGGKQVMATDYRNCGRIILDSTELADRILGRLMPFFEGWDMVTLQNKLGVTGLAGRRNNFHLTRLNERLRFLKYVGGEYFRPHCDGNYRTPDGSEISYYTIQLYLSGEGEEGQDLEEFARRQKKELNSKGIKTEDKEGADEEKLLGGATSFMPSWELADQAVRVWPKTGRVLVFQQNNLWHGGDSVYGGTKYTVRAEVMYSKTPVA